MTTVYIVLGVFALVMVFCAVAGLIGKEEIRLTDELQDRNG